MQIKPEMIREQLFRTTFRGYDREEVRGFLMATADGLEELQDESRLLKADLDALHSKQKDLEELFLQAKRFSDQKFEQASQDAQRILEDAEQRAAALQEKTQLHLEKVEQEARDREELSRQKAREILFEVEKGKVAMERQIVELRTRKASLVAELKGLLEAYQTWIKEMGDVDQPQG